MDTMLAILLSWQFLVFCLGLAAIIFVIRKVVEYFEKDVKDLKLWNELILPIAPIFLGSIIAIFAKMFPFPPEMLVSGSASTSGRFMFGLVAGLLSAWVYKVIKGLLKAKLKSVNENTENSSPENVFSNTTDNK